MRVLKDSTAINNTKVIIEVGEILKWIKAYARKKNWELPDDFTCEFAMYENLSLQLVKSTNNLTEKLEE